MMLNILGLVYRGLQLLNMLPVGLCGRSPVSNSCIFATHVKCKACGRKIT